MEFLVSLEDQGSYFTRENEDEFGLENTKEYYNMYFATPSYKKDA